MGIYLGSLDRPDVKRLIVESTGSGAYAPPHGRMPGYLLWIRDDALVAQRFEPDRAELSGDPIVVRDVNAGSMSNVNLANFSVSNQGTLIYGGFDDRSQLAWFDRAGNPLSTIGAPDHYAAIRLSPTNERVAVSLTDAKGNRDLFDMELARGLPNRLTRDGGNVAVWSPDGRQLAYHDGLSAHLSTVDAAGNHRVIVPNPKGLVYINDWSPDGRSVLYTGTDSATGLDLWLAPANGDADADGKGIPLVATPSSESHGQFSPDGQWIAYTSNESGQPEIYVRGVSGKAALRVSTQGGSFSRWRRDGRELFYRALDGKLMAVPVTGTASGPTFGAAVALMTLIEPLGAFAYPYDISPDGQRVLALAPISAESASAPLTVVVNWDAALGK